MGDRTICGICWDRYDFGRCQCTEAPKQDDTALLRQALEQLEWADNAMPEGEPIQVANQRVIAALKERLK